MVSDKGPGPSSLQKRISTKMKSSEASKVFIKGGKSTVHLCVQSYSEREGVRAAPSWQFELLLWGTCSRFPLANHFDLLGSQSIFGISLDPPMCAQVSLSQGGFHQKGIWIEHPLT